MNESIKRAVCLFLIVGVIISVNFFALFVYASSGQAPAIKVTAYYFHGTARCPTCRKLEQYSREAIEANFKDALASGKLEFKVINLEDRGNQHYGNDYQLYTKSLILSLVKDGKQIKWKNLDKIWEHVGNKDRFIDYVYSEVSGFLKEAK
jgi:hypothetical protein